MTFDRIQEGAGCRAVTPDVSIVVTTRNRRHDLVRCLESCVAQASTSLEIIVYDDASSDGTADVVRRRFPGVRLIRQDDPAGYIALRNRGFSDAAGDYIVSIDDDAYFSDTATVALCRSAFEANPRLGAVAIPFIEPSKPGPARAGILAGQSVRSFIGCAHALRKSAVLGVGGYREFFVHQGEERDLSLRMLEAGYGTVYGSGGPIVHTVSPKRDSARISRYGIRNTLLFEYLNVPVPYLLPRLVYDSVRLACYKPYSGQSLRRVGTVLRSWADLVSFRSERRPVSISTYRLYRSLPPHRAETRTDPIPAPAMQREAYHV
jgi:glycosyltransferase involved in cell wall biosynthesis